MSILVSILCAFVVFGRLEACGREGQLTVPGDKILCEESKKLISCPTGSKIEIVKALYGRQRADMCTGMFRWFNATAKCGDPGKSLAAMKERCDGKSNCNIVVTDKWIGHDPCKNNYKYLQFMYTCRNIRCDENPCANNSTCLSIGVTKYKCDCAPGYKGVHCEGPIVLQGEPKAVESDCQPECLNGGVCVQKTNETHECKCFKPYTGDHCQNLQLKGKDNLCLSSPCQFGSTCHPMINGYQCHCATGFWGKHCHNYNPCWRNPCHNGGSCIAIPPNFEQRCYCATGFSGELCENADDKN